ncbi:UNVERIFIED_CONTAM: hypothetical protein RMT77_004924 [Armadillidium vulgare]
MDQESKENHVHFSEDTDEIGHTLINVKKKNDNSYEVHVGFLQVYHRYEIVINLPLDDAKDGYKQSNNDMQSIFVKVISMEAKKDQLRLVVEFIAHKEKLMKENFILDSPKGTNIAVTIFARVLGKGKGTPMLREEVTCIGQEPIDDESEASDWQGFE